ncbi:hypothetical protein TraAM80_00933 [Trypanosoma rangeli]|uniref:Uncharacterized protein n=1 Tax=Trypanosoma rangeli TaxID=5698 RepID=A0A422P1A7_TRYRA|nr:uncharacterized protein TraAM80_00933 [Trypanosoma rangeli]RNF11487.1 hypothetical protein TraAM80_00933 [Trypanosoma rangeli]|eukprot:RNF11487.1 hypothetical protein TraAM80_00933 [Trypanosoma rangeli]
MLKRSSGVLLALAVRAKSSLSAVEKEGGGTTESEQLSRYVPSSSEAPELLQPYVEPTPFVSARRLQVFLASMGIGATTVWVVYYLLSKSMSNAHEEEELCVQRVVESNRLAMMDPQSLIPDFTAPSSFNELKEKMRQHQRELERQQAEIDRDTIMLHREVVFRMKVWWNASLTHVQEACDHFGVALQRRRERIAEIHIKRLLEEEGYQFVKLRSGNTHIW